MTKRTNSLLGWGALMALLLLATGCEKVTNQAKNLQSDWVGLKRVVEIRSCLDGKLIKRYEGVVRLNPEDKYGASLLIDGKKLHTNMCYIIRERGLREQTLSGGGAS